MFPLHKADEGAGRGQGPLEDSLQEAMWGDLHDDGVRGHMLEGLLEQHRAEQIVDMVVSTGVHG